MKLVRRGNMKQPIQIKLYDFFRKVLNLPDEKAQELVQTIDDAVKGELEGVATKELVKEEIYATKESLKAEIYATKGLLKDEIHATKESLKAEIYATKGLLKDEIHATKESLKAEIQSTKESLKYEIHALELKTIRSIYVSSLIQFLAIVGSVIAIINFMLRK
jgi:hypothetical protein